MSRQAVHASDAPEPKGHYSPAIRAGDFLFISGQGPIDTATGEFLLGTVSEQTALTLENLAAIARAAGGTLADAVKVTAYLSDIKDFAEFNAAYAAAVPSPPPARTTVAVGLPGIAVEIDAILYLPERT